MDKREQDEAIKLTSTQWDKARDMRPRATDIIEGDFFAPYSTRFSDLYLDESGLRAFKRRHLWKKIRRFCREELPWLVFAVPAGAFAAYYMIRTILVIAIGIFTGDWYW